MGKINFSIDGHVEEELFFRTVTKKGFRDKAGVAAMLAAREIAKERPNMPDALEEADSLITQVVDHLERWRVYLKEFLEHEGNTPTHCPGCGGRKIQVNHVTRFPGKLAFLDGRLHEGVDSTEKLERYDDGVILQCQDCTHNWEITTQELDGLMQKMDRGAEEEEVKND